MCSASPYPITSITNSANLITGYDEDSKPTSGFQRVIQRAVIHVQSSGHEEVTGANVLVAIFAERESHAAFFLQEQEMSRYDAVNYISVTGSASVPARHQKPVTPRGAEDGGRRYRSLHPVANRKNAYFEAAARCA